MTGRPFNKLFFRFSSWRAPACSAVLATAIGCGDGASPREAAPSAVQTGPGAMLDAARPADLGTAAAPVDASGAPVDAGHMATPPAVDAHVQLPRPARDASLEALDADMPVQDADAPDAMPDATSAAATCTGKPGALSGKSQQKISVGGTMRSFIVHRPAALDPNAPAPIVIIPHGFTQNAEDLYRITRYWELGEQEGFVTLFPDGATYAGPWNVGQPSCQSVFGLLPLGNADDQAFLDAMLAFVEADQCVDQEHVFIAGFSMGGYFSNETACFNDKFRAIAPHSGGSHDLAKCPGKRKPVIMFHGSGDKLIPYACGKETRERWVKRNGCSSEVEVKQVKNGSCEYHKGCPADAQVAFCTLNDMNHGWAGGAKEQVLAYPDDYPKYESSTQVSWDFFKKYAW